MTDIGPRYPISVRISGVLLHEKTKLYMAQVLWSDQNEITVYRGVDEFMAIHKRMKKIFPPSSPLKKSDRTIPKFRDVKMKRTVKKKGHPSRSIQRCTFLEKYCNDLLCCDPQVTQNSELTKFFHPREQDLQQDFIKNCIMIVPSDQLDGGGGGGRNHFNQAANITQPFVTGTYRCVAPFDTKDTKNRAFKVAVDEKLEVLIKDQAGWWLVENESKHMAWFPAPYLEKVVEDDEEDDYEEDDDDVDGPHGGGAEYIAVRTYKATKGDELSVEIGTRVEVLQKSDNGWWLIRHKGKGGYVPALFLQPYANPCNRLANNGNSRVSPTPGLGGQSFSPQFQHSHSLEVAPSPRVSPTVHHSHSLQEVVSTRSHSAVPRRSHGHHHHTLDVVSTRSHSAVPPRGHGHHHHHTLDVLSAARSRSVSPAVSPLASPVASPVATRRTRRVSPAPVQRDDSQSLEEEEEEEEKHARTPPPSPRAVRFATASSKANELQLPAAAEKQRSNSTPAVVVDDAQRRRLQFVFLAGQMDEDDTLPAGASTPVVSRANNNNRRLPASPTAAVPPVITVEDETETAGGGRRWTGQTQVDSDDSFGSESSDFSIDGFSSSSAGSSFNLTADSLGYTPPPPPPPGRQSSSNYLSPSMGAAMMPATSDPSLYKRSTSPRVPPRPQAGEILARCSTVTRKNLDARAQSPAQVASR